MSEIEFKRMIKEKFTKTGAMVSHFEPNIGSTPGVPDSLVSWGIEEFWLELKVTDKIPTVGLVWNDLLRPAQKRWIKQRYTVYEMDDDQLVPYFVAVESPFGIWLYIYSIFRGGLKLQMEEASLAKLVNHFKKVCGVG